MENCIWFPFTDEPVIESHWYAPAFSSPCVILPAESPDEKWHMFFHSWLGVHHFISDSGIGWEPKRLVATRGHYPSVLIDGGMYHLVYENHEPDGFQDAFQRPGHRRHTSRILVTSSTDLTRWSSPRLLLSGKDVPYSADYKARRALSSPQIMKAGNAGYRLYFGAGGFPLPGRGGASALRPRCEVPRFFGFVELPSLDGAPAVEGSDEAPEVEENIRAGEAVDFHSSEGSADAFSATLREGTSKDATLRGSAEVPQGGAFRNSDASPAALRETTGESAALRAIGTKSALAASSATDEADAERSNRTQGILMEADPDSMYSNLSPGHVRLFSHGGTTYALSPAYYWDERRLDVSSAVMLYRSDDGIRFEKVSENPILEPQKDGWASRLVSSCDVKYKADEDCFYLYFSASGTRKPVARTWLRESIGLFIGETH